MAVAPRMYARSLFQAAKEANSLDVVHAELGEFVAAVDEVPELRGLRSNPQIERHERAAALREILADADAGRLTVELTTAYELSDDDAAAIVKKIEQSSGRTVEATRAVDPKLIGGIVLQVGSHRLDASVRGRLTRLRHDLVTRS